MSNWGPAPDALTVLLHLRAVVGLILRRKVMVRRFNLRQLWLAACATAVALALALPATAQSTGIVKGVVLDASGQPVENAKVNIDATSSNRHFDVKTNK